VVFQWDEYFVLRSSFLCDGLFLKKIIMIKELHVKYRLHLS
jgi:hypothetical protein